MSPVDERRIAHARAVQERRGTLPPEGTPSPEMLDSWVRSMQAGLDSRAAVGVHVVDAADLAFRRERAAVTRRLAQAELETLAQQIAGSNFLLAFADQDGVILDLYNDNRFAMSGGDAGIVAGSCWQESLCGTNGLGTALATGRPTAVTGLEHYMLALGDISCTAAPVRDARGAIVGVLDASSYFASRQHHTQALVQMAATNIENGLLVHQMRAQFVLAMHPRAEFLGTLSAGLLAFDGGGCLIALNARGRQLLQGLDGAPGAAFDDLFCEPFEHVLARLRLGGEVRVRDRLGSTLVVTCVSRPATPQASHVLHAPARELAALPARRADLAVLPPAAPARPAARPAAARGGEFGADIVADDPQFLEALRLAGSAARLAVPILIHGETGSGKELVARHAHQASGRKGPFVAVNCGALPGELFEAELFGYVGGAYTGARREGSAGLIASADGGTLFLDEIRELPLHLQAALLRFLDDRLVRPVGGTKSRGVDVLLLAATHATLADEVAAQRFRADLYYRLDTVRVELPPLRLRRDFATAVRSVLATIDPARAIDDAAVERLARHGWPGNFRELRAVLTRALLAGGEAVLTRADVEPLLPAARPAQASSLQQGASEMVRREFERTGRSVSQTSRNLGISRTTVYRHLREATG